MILYLVSPWFDTHLEKKLKTTDTQPKFMLFNFLTKEIKCSTNLLVWLVTRSKCSFSPFQDERVSVCQKLLKFGSNKFYIAVFYSQIKMMAKSTDFYGDLNFLTSLINEL